MNLDPTLAAYALALALGSVALSYGLAALLQRRVTA